MMLAVFDNAAVTSDTRLAELKTLFAQYWRQGWGDSSPESILREGRKHVVNNLHPYSGRPATG
jgi:hypothetical protein